MKIEKLEPNYRLQKYLQLGQEHIDFFYKAGEHHLFLMTVANKFNNTIIYDIGTYVGQSALALSSNPTNYVISYDIEYHTSPPRVKQPENVEFRIGNCFNDWDNMMKSPLIFMDVAPHDGVFDNKFYQLMVKSKYKGILILDDIYFNKEMKDFWNSIKEEKYDYTHLGHYSGTGLVLFK